MTALVLEPSFETALRASSGCGSGWDGHFSGNSQDEEVGELERRAQRHDAGLFQRYAASVAAPTSWRAWWEVIGSPKAKPWAYSQPIW